MPIGGGTMDIRSILGSIVNFAKSKTQAPCTAPCDGFVLKMHYRWTFFVFLGGFFSVWYSWYHRDVITCVSHFNADNQVRMDYINICLSYPYIELEDENRRYLLFYRWIHWTFLLLAGIYYIPRKISKTIENSKVKGLLEQLARNSYRYDHVEKELVEHASRYILYNKHTHNGLYFKFLALNFVSLAIDLFALHFIDFILQNRFLAYGIKAYPYTRDPKMFSDYMSVTFPPFASCELSKTNQLTSQRAEKLGCHLTFMELYEKIFLFLWLWLYLLTFITVVYIIFLFLMLLPCTQGFILRTSKPEHAKTLRSDYDEKAAMRDTVRSLVKSCKIGDVYVLYRFKQHFSHARFHDLMNRLILSASSPAAPKDPYAHPVQTELHPSQKAVMGDSLRNRKRMGPSTDPPINPDYLQLLVNPRSQHPQQHQDAQQRAPLLNKNTSILIE